MITAVVTTYHKQLGNLEYCLSLLKRGVDRIVCSYSVTKDTLLPLSVVKLCDTVIYHTTPGQYPGEIAATKNGLAVAARDSDYILKVNGDIFFEQAENLLELLDLIEDNDIVAPQWHNHYAYCSTLCFFGITSRVHKAYNDVFCVTRLPQLERKWREQINFHCLKLKIVPMAPEREDQAYAEKNGLWGERFGMRHIHGVIDGKKDLSIHERDTLSVTG